MYSIKAFIGPIEGKILGRQYFGCGSPSKFLCKMKSFLTQFFHFLTDFRNIVTKRIALTSSRPLHVQQSIWSKKWPF